MDYKKKLAMYIPLVDFIADIIGPHCEVLLHDIVDVENSVIAIRNGYISGRYVGCPLTDLGFKVLENVAYQRQNSLVNYRSKTDTGEKLISSTYYIKDEEDKLIGMLCVNILNQSGSFASRAFAEAQLSALFPQGKGAEEGDEIAESLSSSLDGVVGSAIEKELEKCGVDAERLSPEEKNNIIQSLRCNGIFKIKGAISQVAMTLKISESTVYRYLSNK